MCIFYGIYCPRSICSSHWYSSPVFIVISAQLARLQLYWLAVNLAACGSWNLKVLPLAPSYNDDCFMVWPLLKRNVNWPNCLSRSSGYILALCCFFVLYQLHFCLNILLIKYEYTHTLVKHMSLWLIMKNLFWGSANAVVSFCLIVMVCGLVHGQLIPLLQTEISKTSTEIRI